VSECDRCGQANADGARFCSSCGAALPERVREGLEVRKTVTILFCDVVGSTSLGEVTDPETTRRVMARYAESMAEIIAQHGGTVERFRGDEVMAVFGVPVAHEDDALRAVRTATEMQRSLSQLNTELRATWGVELACRIGINTGEVVAGDHGSGEGFVTGDAVNLAKRLEQAAEPGTILIGTATYPLVKDAVTVGPRERFTAKGKRESVGRFRLDEVDTDASGYARRLDAPLVNRTREMDALRHLVREAFDARRCGIVTILGTAGIGKSRIARELASELDAIADVATGRCLPYGSGITFWPLQQLITDLGGLEAATAVMRGVDDGDVVLERLQAVTGAIAATAPSTEVFWAVRRLLERISERRPLLVALEDLHWAEPTMLDLVEYIAAFATGPLVLLCIARPELLETRPSLASTKLDLEQLSDSETAELVEALGIADSELKRRITSTSEGNPLFAEQLAAMMADAAPSDAIELPASIHALLAARIDSLEPAERRMLERASVVGKEFWPRALVALSSRSDQPHVTGRLMTLVRKGLVKPARAEVPGEDAYRFRHALICDETYAGIPKAVRAELHERFARWLQEQARERQGLGFGEHDEILAYHLEQAYRFRTELVPADDHACALAAEAGALLAQAGRRALGREDLPAAVVMFERSLALLPEDDTERSTLLTELGSAAMRAGEWDRARTLLEDAITMAARRGDRRSELRASIELQWQRSYTEPEQAAEDDRRVAEALIPELERIDDHFGLSKAWWLLSQADLIAGRWEPRAAALERAIHHAREAGDEGQLGVLVAQYAQSLYYGPTPVPEAIRRCSELLADTPSSPTLEAGVDTMVAGLRGMEGSFDVARDLYARSVAVYEEFGLRFRRAVRAIVGAQIETLAGDLPAAERELRAGHAMLEEMGERGARSVLAGFLADALALQGRDDEAERFAGIARETAAESDVVPQVLWRRALARSHARRGDVPVAEDLARAAVELADRTDYLDLRAGTRLVLVDVLDGTARAADAASWQDQARDLYRLKGNLAALQALGSPRSLAKPSVRD
jgi:class 3 adenylate cyclase/tetratricopeptide (TPR) repeat protein